MDDPLLSKLLTLLLIVVSSSSCSMCKETHGHSNHQISKTELLPKHKTAITTTYRKSLHFKNHKTFSLKTIHGKVNEHHQPPYKRFLSHQKSSKHKFIHRKLSATVTGDKRDSGLKQNSNSFENNNNNKSIGRNTTEWRFPNNTTKEKSSHSNYQKHSAIKINSIGKHDNWLKNTSTATSIQDKTISSTVGNQDTTPVNPQALNLTIEKPKTESAQKRHHHHHHPHYGYGHYFHPVHHYRHHLHRIGHHHDYDGDFDDDDDDDDEEFFRPYISHVEPIDDEIEHIKRIGAIEPIDPMEPIERIDEIEAIEPIQDIEPVEPMERAERMEGLVPMKSIEEEDGARKNRIPLKYNHTFGKAASRINHRRYLSTHNLTRHFYHLSPHVEESSLQRNPNDHPNVTSDRVLMLPSGTAVVNLDGYQHHRTLVGAVGVDHPATGATGAEYAALGAIDSRVGVHDPANGVTNPATGVTDPAQGVTKEAIKATGAGPNTQMEKGVKLPLNEGFKKDQLCRSNDTGKGTTRNVNETLCHGNMALKKSNESDIINFNKMSSPDSVVNASLNATENTTLDLNNGTKLSQSNITNDFKVQHKKNISSQGGILSASSDFGEKGINILGRNIEGKTQQYPMSSELSSKERNTSKVIENSNVNVTRNSSEPDSRSTKMYFNVKGLNNLNDSTKTQTSSVQVEHFGTMEREKGTEANVTLSYNSNNSNLVHSNRSKNNQNAKLTTWLKKNATNKNASYHHSNPRQNNSNSTQVHNLTKIYSLKNDQNSTKNSLNFSNDPLYNAILNNKTKTFIKEVSINDTKNNTTLISSNEPFDSFNSSKNKTYNSTLSLTNETQLSSHITHHNLTKDKDETSNKIPNSVNRTNDNSPTITNETKSQISNSTKQQSSNNISNLNQILIQNNLTHNSTNQSNILTSIPSKNKIEHSTKTKSIIIGDRRGIVVPKEPIPPIDPLMKENDYPDKIPPIKMDKKDIPMKDNHKDTFDKAPPIEPIDVGRLTSRLLEEQIEPNEPIEMQDSAVESNPPIDPIPPI